MTAGDVLAEIEQRADKAAPGPWARYDGNEGGWNPAHCVANDEFHNPTSDDGDWPAIDVFIECGTKNDAEFIAHARTDVPALVAALRAVLDMVDHGARSTAHPGFALVHPSEIHRAIIEALGGGA